jgi:3-deoxy-D-manno-octulosonic-acid transferase
MGRRELFDKISKAIPGGARVVWMHCSSLGEFEQGRPVLEEIRSKYPEYKLLVTFFSPSGYEVQKDYSGADWIFYLPMDGSRNARRFLDIVHPSLVIFVKYDLWYFYLKEIKKNNIPLLLVSALFTHQMVFFKWYGRLQRKMLKYFTHFFVQNEESKKLLDDMGLINSTIAGDTRYDRVTEIAAENRSIAEIERFMQNSKLIIAGSTWPDDDNILQTAFLRMSDLPVKLLIAPHELSEKNLLRLESLFKDSVRFSLIANGNDSLYNAKVLIIDNIGMLSRIYKYGVVCYVGGGLTNYGVHNVLEAAVYSKPVIIGPYYKKYIEAIGLVNSGGAIVVHNENDLTDQVKRLLTDKEYADRTSAASGAFVRKYTGASGKVLNYIQEKRLLIN